MAVVKSCSRLTFYRNYTIDFNRNLCWQKFQFWIKDCKKGTLMNIFAKKGYDDFIGNLPIWKSRNLSHLKTSLNFFDDFDRFFDIFANLFNSRQTSIKIGIVWMVRRSVFPVKLYCLTLITFYCLLTPTKKNELELSRGL